MGYSSKMYDGLSQWPFKKFGKGKGYSSHKGSQGKGKIIIYKTEKNGNWHKNK